MDNLLANQQWSDADVDKKINRDIRVCCVVGAMSGHHSIPGRYFAALRYLDFHSRNSADLRDRLQSPGFQNGQI